MDKPTQVERIEHILAAISSIREFMNDVTLQAFDVDVILQSAVKWNFLVIGEAIYNVDPAILDKYHFPLYVPKSYLNYFLESYNEVKSEWTYFATRELGELEFTMKLILKNEIP